MPNDFANFINDTREKGHEEDITDVPYLSNIQ